MVCEGQLGREGEVRSPRREGGREGGMETLVKGSEARHEPEN